MFDTEKLFLFFSSVTVRAAVDVKKGEELYSSYTYSLWPTLVRREFLRESKYFDCTCARCLDKTELDTHCGTLKCQRCDNGVILSTDPLGKNIVFLKMKTFLYQILSITKKNLFLFSDDKCEWKCTHCDFKTNAIAVRKIYAAIQADLDGVEYTGGPEGRKKS